MIKWWKKAPLKIFIVAASLITKLIQRDNTDLPYVEIEITRKRKTQRIDTVVAGLYFYTR